MTRTQKCNHAERFLAVETSVGFSRTTSCPFSSISLLSLCLPCVHAFEATAPAARASSLASSVSPLSVMSDSRTSTNRVLAIERRASLVFGCDDSLDRREVALAKRVVLLAIKAFPPSVRLFGIDPVVHDAPADEPRHLSISIPAVKQQSITIVRAVVDGKLRKFHGRL
jgi:hypothetical protein